LTQPLGHGLAYHHRRIFHIRRQAVKIGEFSRVGQVTVKALRVYEEMGLLTPEGVDDWSGYRIYSPSQLPRLYRILALKDLGLSLEEIRLLLEKEPTPEQMRGMLALKSAQIQTKLEEDRRRLALVENLIERIEKENEMPNYAVIVKDVADTNVVSIREKLPGYVAVGTQLMKLGKYFETNRVFPSGPPFTIYHDREYKETDVDVECAFPVAGNAPEQDNIKFVTMPGGKFASTIFTGDFTNVSEAYTAIFSWVETNGYTVSGMVREVYLQHAQDGKGENVTEILVPVAKKA
jgi:effector-binding domain-containing protein